MADEMSEAKTATALESAREALDWLTARVDALDAERARLMERIEHWHATVLFETRRVDPAHAPKPEPRS